MAYIPEGAKPVQEEKEYTPEGAQQLITVPEHTRKKPAGPIGFARKAVHALPEVGQLVGQFQGKIPIVRALAGGVGAMGGEAYRELAGRFTGEPNLPETSGEALQQIVEAGEKGAGVGATGELAALGVGKLGKTATRIAFGAKPEIAEKIAQAGLTATRFGRSAVREAASNFRMIMQKVAQTAEDRGVIFQRTDIADEAKRLLADKLKSHPQLPLLQKRFDRLADIFVNKGNQVSPTELLAERKGTDIAAGPIHKRIEAGVAFLPKNAVDAWNWGLANAERKALNALPDKVQHEGSEYTMQQAAKAYHEFIPIQQAVEKGKPSRLPLIGTHISPYAIGAGIGGASGYYGHGHSLRNAALGAMAGAALSNPGTLSVAGAALTNPLLLNFLRYLPGGASAAMNLGEQP